MRFLNADSLITVNHYKYSNDNPVIHIDDNGNTETTISEYIDTHPNKPVLLYNEPDRSFPSDMYLSRGTIVDKVSFGDNEFVAIRYEGKKYYIESKYVTTNKPLEAEDFFGQNDLHWNSEGQEVSNVQFALYSLGYLTYDQIGYNYRKNTVTAVKEFQNDNGITSCKPGVFNWETREALWRKSYSKTYGCREFVPLKK